MKGAVESCSSDSYSLEDKAVYQIAYGFYKDAYKRGYKESKFMVNFFKEQKKDVLPQLEDYQDDAKLQQKTFAINSAIKGLMSPITMGADKWNTMGSAVRGGLSESVLGTGYYGLRNAMSNTASTLGMNEYVNAPVGEHMVNRAEAPSFGPAPPSQIQRDTADHFANARRSIVDPATPPIHPRFANSINQAMLNQVPSAYRTNMSFNPAGTSGPNPAIVSGNLDYIWLYILAPLTGAFLASKIYKKLI